MSISQDDPQIKTWADLDAANHAHYASKRRPDWVADAERASIVADETHDALIDAYVDGKVEWDAVSEAGARAKAHYEYMMDCRQSWHGGFYMPKYHLDYYLRHNGIPVERNLDVIPACYGLPD